MEFENGRSIYTLYADGQRLSKAVVVVAYEQVISQLALPSARNSEFVVDDRLVRYSVAC